MSVLVDANILVRLEDLDSPRSAVCEAALEQLLRHGDTAHLCAQAAIEYWAVATRPKDVNGLGLDPAQAEAGLRKAERWVAWLSEPPDIAARWRRLVTQHAIRGKQAHDVRLVALMEAHGLTRLLTLNPRDFRRFPAITCLHPADVR